MFFRGCKENLCRIIGFPGSVYQLATLPGIRCYKFLTGLSRYKLEPFFQPKN